MMDLMRSTQLSSRPSIDKPFNESKECPYCKATCFAEFDNTGKQIGPYDCKECFATEIGLFDEERAMSSEERISGWWEPERSPAKRGVRPNAYMVQRSMEDLGNVDEALSESRTFATEIVKHTNNMYSLMKMDEKLFHPSLDQMTKHLMERRMMAEAPTWGGAHRHSTIYHSSPAYIRYEDAFANRTPCVEYDADQNKEERRFKAAFEAIMEKHRNRQRKELLYEIRHNRLTAEQALNKLCKSLNMPLKEAMIALNNVDR